MEEVNEKQGFFDRMKNIFSLKSDSASYEEIEEGIVSGANLYGTNMCVFILSIVIASIGVNMNSIATIIGAMLISPLMGPIIAVGYSIATNNIKLTKTALTNLSLQIVIALITSTIYFLISPIKTETSEILNRVYPTIWDVLIAIFGGFAGIIGITRKEKSNVIPGVSIATALMPPICTAGFGIATANIEYFGGAIYLFLINSFFIGLTALIVTKILKIPVKENINTKKANRTKILGTAFCIIMIIPSVVFAMNIANDTLIRKNVDKYINSEFVFDSTKVLKTNLDVRNNTLRVVLIGQKINDEQLSKLLEVKNKYGLSKIELTIDQSAIGESFTQEEINEIVENDIYYDNSAFKIEEDGKILELEKEIQALKTEINQMKKGLEK